MEKFLNKRYGRLLSVGGYLPRVRGNKNKGIKDIGRSILCVCDCGSGEKRYNINSLQSGSTKSCGCFKKETAAITGRIHGPSNGRKNGLKLRKHNPVVASAKKLYRDYLKRQKNSNLSFDMFFELTRKTCYYCGCEPNQQCNIYTTSTFRRSVDYVYPESFIYNGLDRIDSSKGYDVDNVLTCCKTCNFMKHVLSQQEMFSKIIEIIKYHPEQLAIRNFELLTLSKTTNYISPTVEAIDDY